MGPLGLAGLSGISPGLGLGANGFGFVAIIILNGAEYQNRTDDRRLEIYCFAIKLIPR